MLSGKGNVMNIVIPTLPSQAPSSSPIMSLYNDKKINTKAKSCSAYLNQFTKRPATTTSSRKKIIKPTNINLHECFPLKLDDSFVIRNHRKYSSVFVNRYSKSIMKVDPMLINPRHKSIPNNSFSTNEVTKRMQEIKQLISQQPIYNSKNSESSSNIASTANATFTSSFRNTAIMRLRQVNQRKFEFCNNVLSKSTNLNQYVIYKYKFPSKARPKNIT